MGVSIDGYCLALLGVMGQSLHIVYGIGRLDQSELDRIHKRCLESFSNGIHASTSISKNLRSAAYLVGSPFLDDTGSRYAVDWSTISTIFEKYRGSMRSQMGTRKAPSFGACGGLGACVRVEFWSGRVHFRNGDWAWHAGGTKKIKRFLYLEQKQWSQERVSLYWDIILLTVPLTIQPHPSCWMTICKARNNNRSLPV
jgi:hypothetical protein